MKRLLCKALLTTVVLSSIVGTTAFSETAVPTDSTVLVDGQKIEFNAYNINDTNYFKLRDLAFILRGTANQFDVGYDPTIDSIFLTSNKAYTIVGGEMQKGECNVEEASATDSKLIKDGAEVTVEAYNINDNNYFKLRDLGEEFGFDVDYDEATNSILINTKDDTTNNGKQPAEIMVAGPDDDWIQFNDASTRPTPEPGPTYRFPISDK